MESLDIGHDAAERRLRAIEALDADFHGLLQLKGLSEVLQAKLAVARVRTIARFAAMADSRSAMRQFGNEVLALDPLRDLVEVAALVDAWESATLRVAVRNQAVSEAKVSALPRAVPKVETSNLKEKFEAVHNIKLEDRATPAPSTLEQIFEQIEQGELKNMSIVQFVSREDAEAEILGATIDKSTGNLKVKKGYGECAKPTTPEEFRARANVMAKTYLMAQIKYPQKALLKGLRHCDFQEYVNYLMGDSVLGLQARDQHGQVVSAPSFELALSYDFQLRRLAVRLANEGATFAQALRQARDDLPTKERYFLTPNACTPVACATNAASRSRSPPQRTGHTEAWGHTSATPGASWTWSRGVAQSSWDWGTWQSADAWATADWKSGSWAEPAAGAAAPSSHRDMARHDVTPEGQQICWRWNHPRQRCRYNCGRAHVCQQCFGPHPCHACDRSGPGASG